MKRSEINRLIDEAIDFMNKMNFHLPKWAFWQPEDWEGKKADEIAENMLGWDLTDFGRGNFEKHGLLLFTLRNGNLKKLQRANQKDKSYAEKIMIVKVNQETPFHFHWTKMEDIINRAGGKLVIELYGSTDKEGFSDEPIVVKIDSIPREVAPGGKVILEPGESICLEQGVYHRFYAIDGQTLVGEVSSVNDDNTDNRFYEKLGRFPEIEPDEKPKYLLVTDYKEYLY